MNPLQSRKKLLIAESELNRTQLVQDWQLMGDEVRALTKQARAITFFASAGATLLGVLASFRRNPSSPAAEKPSWWQTLLKGVQLAGPLWAEFRARTKP